MSTETAEQPAPERWRMLGLSTLAFTACFAVWTIFSILGVRIQQELGLSETELGVLLATPVLTGAVSRIFLGIWSEQIGGRRTTTLTMLLSAGACWLLSYAPNYPLVLLGALGVGLAGGVFITGIAFTARWFPKEEKGTALGVYGAGNVGAAVTNFVAPMLIVVLGWPGVAQLYAVALAILAVGFFVFTKDDPETVRRRGEHPPEATVKEQLKPLRYLQVWRFGLYYFFVFGAFVALASWLPRYYVGVYDLSLAAAGTLAATYSFSASVFRALGGYMSDRYGARFVMYLTFIISLVCLFLLSYPPTTYQVEAVDGGVIEFSLVTSVAVFTVITFILGFVMSLGKAAVYKHIPVYYPENVGSVGGMVGMIGGLGGFFLPIIFGVLNDLTNVWTTPFMVLFLLVAVNVIWMHFAIVRMERRKFPELQKMQDLPEAIPPEQQDEAWARAGATDDRDKRGGPRAPVSGQA